MLEKFTINNLFESMIDEDKEIIMPSCLDEIKLNLSNMITET